MRLHTRFHWSSWVLLAVLSGTFVFFAAPQPSAAELSSELKQALDSSKYVYIQSERKSGELGSKAEIWFFEHDGAVWVGTPVTTYRVRRIQAGRTKAKIWIGSRDGQSFDATGSLVKDDAINEIMYKTFAEKYSDGWPRFEESFRSGFADGSRTLVRYDPAGM